MLFIRNGLLESEGRVTMEVTSQKVNLWRLQLPQKNLSFAILPSSYHHAWEKARMLGLENQLSRWSLEL